MTNVTDWSSLTLNPESELIANFGTWTYSSNNKGYTAVPTTLQFEAYGAPITGSLLNVPGSSVQYYSGYQLTGYLESADGSVVVALNDPNAARSGMAAGTLLVTPGSVTGAGGTQAVSVLTASVTLSESTAESLFGPDAAQPWVSDARIVLVNQGNPLSLGLGGSSTIKSAVSEPGLQGLGPVQVGGVTTSVELIEPVQFARFETNALGTPSTNLVPEPSGIYLLAGGLGMMGIAGWLKARWLRGCRSSRI
jgi:hypothetical protein